MKNKKQKINHEILVEAIVMIILVVSMPIVFSKLNAISENNSQKDIIDISFEKTLSFFDLIPSVKAQGYGCCITKEINSNTYTCSLRFEQSSCSAISPDYQWLSGKTCNQVVECNVGCCAKYEDCAKNTNKKTCEANEGTFYPDKTQCENIQECGKVCCRISGSTTYITGQQCNKIGGESIGVSGSTDFEREIDCALVALSYPLGCCILGDKSCTFTNNYACSAMNGIFNVNRYCTDTQFKAQCPGLQSKAKKTCYNNEIYWTDNYDNLETLYENCTINNKICQEDDNGNPYCKTSSCTATLPNTTTVTIQNYGSICVYDQQLDPYYKDPKITSGSQMGNFGIDVVGSEHWIWTCINGKFYPELCGTGGRSEVCVEQESQRARCVMNPTSICLTATTKEECYKPQTMGLCYWLGDDATAKSIANTLSISFFLNDIKKIPGFIGEYSSACLPKYPSKTTGLSISGEVLGYMGTIIQQKKGEFEGEWDCDGENCDVLKGKIDFDGDKEIKDFAKESIGIEALWGYLLAKRCSSLGDYGIKTNLIGNLSKGVEFKSKCFIGEDEEGPGTCEGDREDYAYWLATDESDANSWGQRSESVGYNTLVNTKDKLIDEQKNIKVYDLDSSYDINNLLKIFVLPGITGESIVAIIIGKSAVTKILALPFMAKVGIALAIGTATKYLTQAICKSLGMSSDDAQVIGNIAGGALAGASLAWLLGASTSVGGLIGLGVAILIFAFMAIFSEDQRGFEYQFSCLPYQPPYGGDNCELCNQDPLRPCNSYRCQSLGASCQFVSRSGIVGTDGDISDGYCFAYNIGDNLPPKITRVHANDFGIEEEDYNPIQGHVYFSTYLQYLNPEGITIKITTDERSLCRWKISDTALNFDDMPIANMFDNLLLNYYSTTHEKTFLGIQAPRDGNLTIKVSCVDTNGNKNLASEVFTIKVPVSTDDTIPPRILDISPRNNAGISKTSTTVEARIYINEPVNGCRWSLEDIDYASMPLTQAFGNCGITDGRLSCTANLPFNSNLQENKYYIRCEDKQGNLNTYSYEYFLRPVEPLEILNAQPTGNIESCANEWNVTLSLKTANGSNYGSAICYYEENSILNKFDNTNYDNHLTQLRLLAGNHNYKILCLDESGNSAQTTISFTIVKDLQPPQITRIYNEGNNFVIRTSKPAVCYYNKNENDKCNYAYTDSLLKTGTFSANDNIIHMTGWRLQPYYLKCQDLCGNGGRKTDSCTVVYPQEV